MVITLNFLRSKGICKIKSDFPCVQHRGGSFEFTVQSGDVHFDRVKLRGFLKENCNILNFVKNSINSEPLKVIITNAYHNHNGVIVDDNTLLDAYLDNVNSIEVLRDLFNLGHFAIRVKEIPDKVFFIGDYLGQFLSRHTFLLRNF